MVAGPLLEACTSPVSGSTAKKYASIDNVLGEHLLELLPMLQL